MRPTWSHANDFTSPDAVVVEVRRPKASDAYVVTSAPNVRVVSEPSAPHANWAPSSARVTSLEAVYCTGTPELIDDTVDNLAAASHVIVSATGNAPSRPVDREDTKLPGVYA